MNRSSASPPREDRRPKEDLPGSASAEMADFLHRCIEYPSVSGHEGDFVRFIEQWSRSEGFETDLWETEEWQVSDHPVGSSRHLPLKGRPSLVVRLPGHGGGRSLLFNAHADVVASGDPAAWTWGPWSGARQEGRIYGRGACDTKGPLVSALWAMRTVRNRFRDGLAGDVLLELIPGEEDCVGLGTLTSVKRGWAADAVVVLEPTESLPRCASRAGCRFQIVCRGRSAHGSVKWLGVDAIVILRYVLEALANLEQRWNERGADPLFASCPIARPVTVDTVKGGEWQGMICDRATCEGYLELLPGDPIDPWKRRFEEELRNELFDCVRERGAELEIGFGEEYAGHRTPEDHGLCDLAGEVAARHRPATDQQSPILSGFNSGCEAGLRAGLQGTPTLVWGPGSLAQAHAVDEFIELSDVLGVAGMFTEFLGLWSSQEGDKLHDVRH